MLHFGKATLPRPGAHRLQLYAWRHDNVLRVIYDGVQPYADLRERIVAVDLDRARSTLPKSLAKNSRPDLVLTSHAHNTLVIAELTCPLPENMERWSRLKRDKYQPIVSEAQQMGWCASLWTLEVSSAGHVSRQTLAFFREVLEMPRSKAIELAVECGLASKASTEMIARRIA